MIKDKKYVNIIEFEEEAKNHLNQNSYQYYRSGATSEHTLKSNIEDFSKILLNPYVCSGLTDIDISTTILGHKINIPVAIAPTAMNKMAHDLGELNLVRAASKKGTIYTQSTLSTTSMEDVSKEVDNSLRFFQLYVSKNRNFTFEIVKNAEKLNYKAIVLTVDAPWLGIRDADERNNFSLPKNLKLEILEKYSDQMKVQSENNQGSGLLQLFAKQIEQNLKWDDVKWLQSITKLPIILKGIQNGEDALKAARLGAHIWVSNHGGRQLDTVRSTINILPEVMESIKDYKNKVEVYVDGGIRRGTDVIKCLALGAKCVFVGRPTIYANASEGEQGILKMFDIFEKEIKNGMMLLGTGKVEDLGLKHLIKHTIARSNL
ncbi:hypothetical protein IMG5_158180 [Ichthyophthirius multifiliis]|uniref:FMN hydroxy acid dehydrogenase domain-containing protein n=1 Tax=Ichthyophthirius multifiliis TaxID=5932 RepID=G0QZM1_ICHMU|nr:hypothetical protein IMG5_158180 [Ichthyophthirius multifiliis]EGR29332.1 hypothetical protein IMG5_158180 [Ichthyophthirius multifiliis]|eukprot:XP_004030568.1 hypothetical protein IMG5_158180 [Ichthyophthirius multifiliis]